MLRGATITGDTTGEITLNVKGAENQTAALLNVEDNAGNDHLNIDKDGVTTLSSLVATTADINAGTVDAVIGGTAPAAGTFTTLTANDQLVVSAGATITGDTTGEITLNVKGAENQTAALLNVQDNGENDHLNIDKDGVTTLSSLVATTADINAGTVDAVIGGTAPAAGTFTTLTANDQLVVAAGATITGDTAGEITLNVKGAENQTAALLNVQDNGENDHLNIDKDGVTTLSSLVATTADINAGTVDAVIGGTAPAAGTFTTLTANDQLVVAARCYYYR